MSLLTDSEQVRLLNEAGPTTQTKIEAALRKFKLDRVPADVEALRKENAKRHSVGRGLWNALWHGLGVTKSEGDKLFKD